jgi:DNA polymerase-4
MQYYSRQRHIGSPIDSTGTLYRHARELFKQAWKFEPVRLLAVRTAGLHESGVSQLSLFGQRESDRQGLADRSIDAIRYKYGDQSVMRASFLCRNKKENHDLDKFSPFKATGSL